jgi:RNA polymerase sigma-70 factor (ECF subfamily)
MRHATTALDAAQPARARSRRRQSSPGNRSPDPPTYALRAGPDGDAVAADDLVQDCLGRALAKIHQWQKGTDLRAWLFTILHSQHVGRVRREARERASIEQQKFSLRWALPPPQIACLELRDMERALAKLPEEQRSVVLLVGAEGMGYEEAAAVLNVPSETVRSRLSRGRESLRKATGLFPCRQSRRPGTAATLDCSSGPMPISATIG